MNGDYRKTGSQNKAFTVFPKNWVRHILAAGNTARVLTFSQPTPPVLRKAGLSNSGLSDLAGVSFFGLIALCGAVVRLHQE
jgi:hypothetical protein